MMELADMDLSQTAKPQNFLLLTALDYRTPRKANIHFIADELVKRGKTRFFSMRYSWLSQYKADPRCALDARANQIEVHKEVECFLWKTPLHPFNTHRKLLRPVEALGFQAYRKFAHPVLRQWLREADIIFFESGVSPVFFDLATEVNPSAKKNYIASDDLQTIDVADFVQQCFAQAAPRMAALCLPSRALDEGMPASANKFFVPHGVDHSIAEHADPNPYSTGLHAVSVGSMLFDANFFRIAAAAFPEVHYHIIGSGHDEASYPDNVTVFPEMRFKETLPYIKHASFGIAPYRSAAVPSYLADTSMKLMQYDFFGVPAVCPETVVGNSSTRFGYVPGDALSIHRAIERALKAPRVAPKSYLSWSAVADRLIAPTRYADTRW